MTHQGPRVRHTKKKSGHDAAGAIGRAEARRQAWTMRTLITKYGGKCALCGEPVVARGDEHGDDSATADHIVARSKGGSDAIANLQLAHRRCNLAKGAS